MRSTSASFGMVSYVIGEDGNRVSGASDLLESWNETSQGSSLLSDSCYAGLSSSILTRYVPRKNIEGSSRDLVPTRLRRRRLSRRAAKGCHRRSRISRDGCWQRRVACRGTGQSRRRYRRGFELDVAPWIHLCSGRREMCQP